MASSIIAATTLLGLVWLTAPAPGSGDEGRASAKVHRLDRSWAPNRRIGQIFFNRPLPRGVKVVARGRFGKFVARLTSGAIVRGFLFADPQDQSRGDVVRHVYTLSRLVSYRGVRVGTRTRTARRRLGRRFKRRQIRGPGFSCSRLNSFSLRGDVTGGPASTQVWLNRRGRVWRITLDEITEIGCPGPK